MNRLILIGNGFDLANGLKTSYSDFMRDYISNCINSFYVENIYTDTLLEIKWKYAGHTYGNKYTLSTPENALDEFQKLRNSDYFMVNIKSVFLSDTLKRISEINWVDMESDYFDQLLGCKGPNKFNFDRVKQLNIQFDFLKGRLEEYLIRQETKSSLTYLNAFTDIFLSPIMSKDIVTESVKDQMPKKILFLNFNYTSLLKKYNEVCSEIISTETNHIHGELGSISNPIIFGFGDEFNKSYLEFEELRNNELFKHIKSFAYFKTSNYHNLIRFIDADKYQVYVFGHSLGLSDRTMLKQIFEHRECKSVKIFYYKKSEKYNDYTDKTFAISSHFSDKGIMRKKIVPFNLSTPIPQLIS